MEVEVEVYKATGKSGNFDNTCNYKTIIMTCVMYFFLEARRKFFIRYRLARLAAALLCCAGPPPAGRMWN